MPRFLSPEWVDELARAAEAAPSLRGDLSDVRLELRYVVPDAPGGEIAYTVSIANGRVRVDRSGQGPSSAVGVTLLLRAPYETAVALHRGERTAQDALACGALKVAGNLDALVRHRRALVALADVFASLREATTYDRPPDGGPTTEGPDTERQAAR